MFGLAPLVLAAAVHGPLLAAGPVLAGGRVVWGEQESGLVRMRASGGRVLYERRATAGGGVEQLELAASPQLVAARLAVTRCPAPTAGTASPCDVTRPVE